MPANARVVELPFPSGGLDESTSYEAQPQRGDDSLPTSVDLSNVRAFDPVSGRNRGGQRGGLSKFLASQINSSNRIQDINHVTYSSGTPSATQQNVRLAKYLAIAAGTVKTFTSSGVATPTNGGSALSSTMPQIFSTALFEDVFFADGTNVKYYDAGTDTVSTWTPSAGTLPVASSDRCRLIATWRGRIVLSGLKGDDHNWFMSASGYPFDWDYAPDPVCDIQAVAGNNSLAGYVGDRITSIVPYNDDMLIWGCDHSIWILRGDPMHGGVNDMLSDITGMAWGRPWCKSPEGLVYFFGSRGGVFALSPDGGVQRLSRQIDERLAEVNLNTSSVRLIWNDREQGVHVFITSLTASADTHYFYDVRNGAWFRDAFATNAHNPVAVHTIDGDSANDRFVLLGGGDGYIRKWDVDADDDDGTAISSYAYLGPITGGGAFRKSVLDELEGVMATGADDVTYSLYVGDNAEHAYAQSAWWTGTWSAGRNTIVRRRAVGDTFYLKISQTANNTNWAMERVACTLRPTGTGARRHY